MSKTYQNSKDWQKLVFQNAKVLRNITTIRMAYKQRIFLFSLETFLLKGKNQIQLVLDISFLIPSISLYKFQQFFAKKSPNSVKILITFLMYRILISCKQELFKERPPSNILEAADNRALICTYEQLSPHLDVIGWLKTSLFSLPG